MSYQPVVAYLDNRHGTDSLLSNYIRLQSDIHVLECESQLFLEGAKTFLYQRTEWTP